MCLLLAVSAYAGDWPQFAGPTANYIAPDTGINKNWAEKPPKQLWRVNLNDGGFAGPSQAQGKVFIIDHEGDQDVVRAIDLLTGQDVWRCSYQDTGQPNYGFARSTPVFSEGKLYTLSRLGILNCINADDGQIVWSRNIVAEFGGQRPQWDFAMSPLVDGSKVVVLPGGQTGIAALDKNTGQTIWKGGSQGPPGYSTPVVAMILGRKQYVVVAGKMIYGVDAEKGGPSLWTVPWETQYDINAAQAIVEPPFVFVASGYQHGCCLIQVTEQGAKIYWESKDIQAQFNTPVYYKGYIFGNSDTGEMVCLSPQNGTSAWRKGGFKQGGVVAVDDVIISVNGEGGDVVMVNATAAGYEELGRIKPLGGKSWTAPIIADGKLIVRNNQAMVCLDLM
jgi:outer membrane protein assembly factor BamB